MVICSACIRAHFSDEDIVSKPQRRFDFTVVLGKSDFEPILSQRRPEKIQRNTPLVIGGADPICCGLWHQRTRLRHKRSVIFGTHRPTFNKKTVGTRARTDLSATLTIR